MIKKLEMPLAKFSELVILIAQTIKIAIGPKSKLFLQI